MNTLLGHLYLDWEYNSFDNLQDLRVYLNENVMIELTEEVSNAIELVLTPELSNFILITLNSFVQSISYSRLNVICPAR
jgi:hypothetical protein